MTEKLQLHITGMDCADCALKLERGVGSLAGVEACQVNCATAQLHLTTIGANEAQIVKRIQRLGYNVVQPDEFYKPRTHRQQLLALLSQPRNTFTLIGAAFILAAFIALSFPSSIFYPLSTIFFLIGGLFGLYFPARLGWAALRSGQGL